MSKWLTWKPASERTLANSAGAEPTKRTELTETTPDPAFNKLVGCGAVAYLNAVGARQVRYCATCYPGAPHAAARARTLIVVPFRALEEDGELLTAALRILHMGHLAVLGHQDPRDLRARCDHVGGAW